MPDLDKDKRITFYLKVWMLLHGQNMVWEDVRKWLEQKINEEFE